MRKGNHILAFSDSVEKQILHTGHQSASIDTNKTNCSVSFALRARSCACVISHVNNIFKGENVGKHPSLTGVSGQTILIYGKFSVPPNTISLRPTMLLIILIVSLYEGSGQTDCNQPYR